MLYQVWSSRGQGLQPGPRFRILDDAIRFTSDNSSNASFAVRGPGGEWVHIQPRDIVASADTSAGLTRDSRDCRD